MKTIGHWRLPWYRAVNWDVVLTWFCLGSLALCLAYLGIFVFAPFAVKIVWE